MAKHFSKSDLINNIRTQQKINSLVPQVYASMVITLIDYYGWSFDEIKTLIDYNQEVWNRCNAEGIKMLKKCSDEYGIDLIEIIGGNDTGEMKKFI